MPEFVMSQMHIEAARNSTDDFNLFHDKNRWQQIADNPFKGAIALGFQLGCFVEDQITQIVPNPFSVLPDEKRREEFRFSQYELTFAGSVGVGDHLSIVVKPGRYSENGNNSSISHRIALKANNKTVMLGYKRLSNAHLIKGISDLPAIEDVVQASDRSFIGNAQYFVKRKFMIVGNAKNFLTSAFAEQSQYIDEFIDKVTFPQMYPMSLLSSALLERAQAQGHDLIKAPMIYVSHKLSINHDVLATLSSNHAIYILVSPAQYHPTQNEDMVVHQCSCLVANGDVLFHAEIQLAPLSSIMKK